MTDQILGRASLIHSGGFSLSLRLSALSVVPAPKEVSGLTPPSSQSVGLSALLAHPIRLLAWLWSYSMHPDEPTHPSFHVSKQFQMWQEAHWEQKSVPHTEYLQCRLKFDTWIQGI